MGFEPNAVKLRPKSPQAGAGLAVARGGDVRTAEVPDVGAGGVAVQDLEDEQVDGGRGAQ
jgi:hypothetical protein